ncbi:MAG: hypothetical protein IPJ74_04255 [Saprospiraceae bacterium]|nr:hypothetical protein [Saprospiraceae bacterium]
MTEDVTTMTEDVYDVTGAPHYSMDAAKNAWVIYFLIIKTINLMQKNYYLPRGDKEKDPWLQNIAAKLPLYAAKYNISQEDVMGTQTDAVAFDGLMQYKTSIEAYCSGFFGFKDLARDGAKGIDIIQMPMPPTPMFNGPIRAGIFARVIALVARIKAHPNYNIADGYDLGIEGTEKVLEFNDLKPLFSIRLVNGGHPELVWKKKGMSGIEIQKEDADGNFITIGIDSSPNYIDMAALPPKGTSAVWRYRIIYLYKDQRVGQWSDVVSVTVMG